MVKAIPYSEAHPHSKWAAAKKAAGAEWRRGAAHWPYYELINGKLYDDKGYALLSSNGVHAPRFADAATAEEWLKANDLRGNVR